MSKPDTRASNANTTQLTNEAFLLEVGQRVRRSRAARGMSRKLLSQQSDVSERYLANLEQGHGNISINLLRQVARALGTDIAELFPGGKQATPESALISDFVARLSREEQRTALDLLYKSFTEGPHKTSRIALIGLRGAGKTTLGRMLEEHLHIPFVRLTQKIETLAEMSLAEVLNLYGQRGYRRIEEKALFETLHEFDSVCIEAGGSIVSEFKGLNLLLTTCTVVWIRASPEEHMERVVRQGDLRPMQDIDDAMADLREILEERIPFYEQAHLTLDTSGKTVEQSFQELLALLASSPSD